MICDRGTGMTKRSFYRHPFSIAVQPLEVVPGSELLVLINSADKRRRCGLRVGKHPSTVFEDATCADIHQLVLGTLEFH